MANTPLPICRFCDEPVRPNDEQTKFANGEPAHMECFFRQVTGSVAHIQKRCNCFIPGSDESDPEGMTRRQAARAAVDTYKAVTFADVLNQDGACPLCGCKEFHPGPRGGAARNIMCAQCGTKYCYCPPFTPGIIWNEDSVYDRRVSERL